MARAKKGTKDNPITLQDVEKAAEALTAKPLAIIEASIKDDFCDYTYEVLTGVGTGRTHKVVGKNSGLIISDDLRDAMARLSPHMACIDMAFKDAGKQVDDINAMANDEQSCRYYASGFKIKGVGDESIIIIGNKNVDMGWMPFESPKISISEDSSYKWYNELKAIADELRREVEAYDGGKGTKINKDDDKPDPKQGKLFAKAEGGEEFDDEDDNEQIDD